MSAPNIIDTVVQNSSNELISRLNRSEGEISEKKSPGKEKKVIGSNYTIGKKIYILI